MGSQLGNGVFTLKEFYNRGVIKLAPDVLVYINGSLATNVVAPITNISAGNNLTFDDGISNVSIQNTCENPGSSTASIEILTPLYGPNSNYWVLYPGPNNDISNPIRAPLFVPMMEVKIFLKGRFLVNNQPKYYPAFWGFITNVEESYSGGLHKIILSCGDILHWWSYSTLNVHPNIESDIAAGGGQSLTVFSTIFETNNPFEIITALNNLMGMSNFVTPVWAGQLTSLESIYPPGTFDKVVTGNMMSYWRKRFANTANLLKMYGLDGNRVDSKGVELRKPAQTERTLNKSSDEQDAKTRKNKNKYIINNTLLQNFTVFFDFSKMADFSRAEYMTKLDVAIEIKNRCDYEFFQDVNGNIIFKPPFYNLNVRGIQPYTILPSEIINNSFNTDAEGIITVLSVTTSFDPQLRETSFAQGQGFHMDIDLAKKYGVRAGNVHMEYISDPTIARTLALGQISRMNAKTITGALTIPGRPELRLGYPIYMEHRDSFHYIKSITHSFDYGGSFNSTLSLETERRKVFFPIGDQWDLQRDKIYRLSTSTVPTTKTTPDDPPSIYDFTERVFDKNTSSIRQGGYVIDDRNPALGDLERVVTYDTVPFTDEEGYRVIGSFLYGRTTNALCVDTKTENIQVLKDVYLTTMARPVYENESKAMDSLFFRNQEGAVPAYLNFNNEFNGHDAPMILGQITDSTTSILVTVGVSESLVNAMPQNVPSTNPSNILKNVKVPPASSWFHII